MGRGAEPRAGHTGREGATVPRHTRAPHRGLGCAVPAWARPHPRGLRGSGKVTALTALPRCPFAWCPPQVPPAPALLPVPPTRSH